MSLYRGAIALVCARADARFDCVSEIEDACVPDGGCAAAWVTTDAAKEAGRLPSLFETSSNS
jgi:hypothetical protein